MPVLMSEADKREIPRKRERRICGQHGMLPGEELTMRSLWAARGPGQDWGKKS